MKHLSYDNIHNRLKNLGTFGLYVRASDNIYVMLDYLYSELWHMCENHLLCERGCIFKIEYRKDYGIIVKSIHCLGSERIKCFKYDESDFEKLQRCLIPLSKYLKINVKNSSFEKAFTVAFRKCQKIEVAG